MYIVLWGAIYKYSCSSYIKSNCEEKGKQVTFLTEVINPDEKYIICICLKFLIWTIEG